MRGLKGRLKMLGASWQGALKTNQEISKAARLANVYRIYWTSLVMVLSSAGIAALFAIRVKGSTSPEVLWRLRIVALHLLTAGISLLIWLGAGRLRKRGVSGWLLVLFAKGVAAFVLSVGIALTVVDHLVMANVSALLICSTIAGTFYYFRPGRSAVLFALSFWSFRWALLHWTDLPPHLLDSSLANGFAASLLGFALSTLTWRHFRHDELQKKKIAQQQALLEKQACQDPLTNLPNRRLLDKLVAQEVDLIRGGGYTSSLIIFDLDDFKAVNERFGHLGGDAVLRELGDLLPKSMPPSATLVRLGGDEFVVLLANAPLSAAVALAQRLQTQLEKHEFQIGGEGGLRLTATFGIAPLGGREEFTDYYFLADQALFRAKQLGKNRIEVAAAV